eukprot:373422-Rhodomonas_salina.1
MPWLHLKDGSVPHIAYSSRQGSERIAHKRIHGHALAQDRTEQHGMHTLAHAYASSVPHSVVA